MPGSPLLARLWRVAALCLLAHSVAACFYDHRVTQAIQERRRQAKAAEGARIAGSESKGALPLARRVGRVRLYVAADYRQRHPAWQRELETMVDELNPVLRESFALRLEVSELHEWSPACAPEALAACLEELAAIPLEGQTEWVVGVLGAQPRFTSSFDELGMAHVPGRHFVIRDLADVAERAAIDRAFPTHRQERRDEIYAQRLRHKRLSVFLHEWAHSLGGLHTDASDALLHPTYNDRMSHFDPGNGGLLTASLDDAFSANAEPTALIAQLERTPADDFAQGEHAALLARLRAGRAVAGGEVTAALQSPEATEPANVQPSHAFLVKGHENTLLAELTEQERALYRKAVLELVAERASEALTVLKPLVAKYEQNYAIQHLACGLYMELGYQQTTQAVCARAQSLALAPHPQ